MADIEKAIKFPFSGADWLPKLVVGGALNIVPIVNFLSIGYAYRVFRSTVGGDDAVMPEWKSWDDLFVKGFIVAVVALGYSFVPAFITVLGINLITKGWLSSFLGGLLLIIGFAACLAALFFLPMAIANYVSEGERIGEAFKFRAILGKIEDIQNTYLVSYLVGIGILILAGLLLLVPLVKYFVFSIGLFYVYLFLSSLFGETCTSAVGLAEETVDNQV